MEKGTDVDRQASSFVSTPLPFAGSAACWVEISRQRRRGRVMNFWGDFLLFFASRDLNGRLSCSTCRLSGLVEHCLARVQTNDAFSGLGGAL